MRDLWRRARAVEWAALEMRYTGNGIGGSNPPASAKNHISKNQGWLPRRVAPRHGISPPESKHF